MFQFIFKYLESAREKKCRTAQAGLPPVVLDWIGGAAPLSQKTPLHSQPEPLHASCLVLSKIVTCRRARWFSVRSLEDHKRHWIQRIGFSSCSLQIGLVRFKNPCLRLTSPYVHCACFLQFQERAFSVCSMFSHSGEEPLNIKGLT